MRKTMLILAALALTAGACSSGGPATAGCPGPERDAAPRTDKPVITVPDGPPPATLQTEDLIEGTGAEVVTGCGLDIEVQYVGVSWSTGKEFDASWDRNEPFSFNVGAGGVIPGWDEGVVGMKVGGRRQLIIPPDKAYGAAGAPPVIAPNETLVFVIDLLAINGSTTN